MQHNMFYVRALAILTAIGLLAGCATVPKTPDQAVYATYGLYVTVGNLTADLLAHGTIDVDQAKDVQAALQRIRPQIKAARLIVAGGGTVDNQQLAIVRALRRQLLAIQHQLQQEAAQ